MDIHERLRKLMNERRWSEYRLSKESRLSESTIANIFRRNTIPSISTLESICSGFGVTMSQFFTDNEMIEMTDELKELFSKWISLTTEEKSAVMQIIRYIER